MKTVLYTFDFEPITVIELPINLYNSIEKEHIRYIRLWVRPERVCIIHEHEPIVIQAPEEVTLLVEKFIYREKTKFFFFVREEELVNAFKLNAVYLPGQNRLRRETYSEGVSDGIAKALIELYNHGMLK
jgi:hypothetical protein